MSKNRFSTFLQTVCSLYSTPIGGPLTECLHDGLQTILKTHEPQTQADWVKLRSDVSRVLQLWTQLDVYEERQYMKWAIMDMLDELSGQSSEGIPVLVPVVPPHQPTIISPWMDTTVSQPLPLSAPEPTISRSAPVISQPTIISPWMDTTVSQPLPLSAPVSSEQTQEPLSAPVIPQLAPEPLSVPQTENEPEDSEVVPEHEDEVDVIEQVELENAKETVELSPAIMTGAEEIADVDADVIEQVELENAKETVELSLALMADTEVEETEVEADAEVEVEVEVEVEADTEVEADAEVEAEVEAEAEVEETEETVEETVEETEETVEETEEETVEEETVEETEEETEETEETVEETVEETEEETVEEVEETEEEEEEEAGMEVEQITIRGKNYWIETNTKKLYAIVGEDDVGDEVGAMVGGKAVFV